MKKKKNISNIYIFLLVFSLILSSFFHDDLSALKFNNVTQYAGASEKLNEFYKELDATFCTEYSNNECIAYKNSYIIGGNLDLITTDIYNKAGGDNSFLASSISYWNNTGDIISYNNSAYGSEHGIRAVANLKNNVKVKGSGTLDDPYTIVESDAFISGFTIDGVENSNFSEFPTRNDGLVATVECTNGTGIWDAINWGLLITNMNNSEANCKIHFTTAELLSNKILVDNGGINNIYKLEINNYSPSTIPVNYEDYIMNDWGLYYSVHTYKSSVCPKINCTDYDSVESACVGECKTYFFRGNVTNNNVVFGKDSEGNDLYWKIVRINEDGSIRLIFNGTQYSEPFIKNKSNQIINSDYNIESASNPYFVHSNVKKELFTWYENNILENSDGINKYDDYISKTAIYCNLMSEDDINSGKSYSGSYDIKTRYDSDTIIFGAETQQQGLGYGPSFKCSSSKIIADIEGPELNVQNDSLPYGVALLTGDEAIYAGIVRNKGVGNLYSSNAYTYLNKNGTVKEDNIKWWTMSTLFLKTDGEYMIASIDAKESGNIYESNSSEKNYIRPVLSLKSCVYTTGGDGTFENPYSVGITNECKNANN